MTGIISTVNVWYNMSDFHYTELTPLGKVWQKEPLILISYSTISEQNLFHGAVLTFLLVVVDLVNKNDSK